MSNEITYTVSVKFEKGTKPYDTSVEMSKRAGNISVTGTDFVKGTQNIATSAEALALGDIGTPGVIIVHNLDATNYVEIGYDDSGFKPTIKILPGEFCMFRSAQAAPQAQANTSACNIEYMIIEE